MSMAGRLPLAASLCCALAAPAQAAGGHFAVDDATILDVDECQLEAWLERGGSASTLLHLGPACRVGPVELGINIDRLQAKHRSPVTVFGPQVKAVAALGDRLSVGVVAIAGWQGDGPHAAVASLYAPVTVRVLPSLWLHGNAGRDWVAGRSASSRAGLALEWQALDRLAVIGEGFRQAGANFERVGLRWQASAFSIDLSRAFGASQTARGWWALGVNGSFDVAAGARRPRQRQRRRAESPPQSTGRGRRATPMSQSSAGSQRARSAAAR